MAHKKTTSKKVATEASGLLRSGKSSKKVKSVAGSALSQKHKKNNEVIYKIAANVGDFCYFNKTCEAVTFPTRPARRLGWEAFPSKIKQKVFPHYLNFSPPSSKKSKSFLVYF